MPNKSDNLSRRSVLKSAGLLALGAAVPGCQSLGSGDGDNGAGNPDCVLTPTLTEGPYYLDLDLVRSDIAEGKAGVPLRLVATIVQAESCTPIPDVAFEIWHADAEGVYSGFQNEGTAGQTFCRGVQVTGADGKAEFQTIYPGWYSGRAVHIHAKVQLSSNLVVTTQFFFPDDLTDTVFANNAPYNARGQRNTLNANDNIFPDDTSVVLNVVADGAGGYTCPITIGVSQ